MANKTTANAFMASAQKSKREMADIQKEGSGKHETDEVELKKISLLIPAWLHKEAQLHRVETGESMTKLMSHDQTLFVFRKTLINEYVAVIFQEHIASFELQITNLVQDTKLISDGKRV